MVVVDRFTKYPHFLSLTHPFSAETVARIFNGPVYKLHGLPINIISDRDRIFTETFWKELFRPKHWNKWLSLAEYWYNTNFHTGLKLIPFQALYGYLPGPLTVDPYIPTSQPDVEEYMKERSKLLEVLKLNLAEAQNRIKLRRNLKLAPKYYRLFQVLARNLFHVQETFSKSYREDMRDATWEDYYAFVAKFPDFEIDPQGRGSNLPGGNVTAIAGGRRRNLHRPSSNKSSRMIKGTRIEGNDVVPLKKGKTLLKGSDVI
ncbi:UNVERIFIED_CONTAM: hypothetical protein Slati_3040900 [Sesamum latifolium]|uniref:Integrase catalytic domain-containing protein n=1 Tax=Sesamum latifolium TaxID=2727402 RepID=A0AAW2VHV8_9LAMI